MSTLVQAVNNPKFLEKYGADNKRIENPSEEIVVAQEIIQAPQGPISAFRACWTVSIVYKNKRAIGESNDSITSFMEANWRQLPRAFAQSWLGIGKWEKDRGIIANSQAIKQKVDQQYNRNGKIFAVFRIVILLPITVIALTIKIADFVINYSRWNKVGSVIHKNPETLSTEFMWPPKNSGKGYVLGSAPEQL